METNSSQFSLADIMPFLKLKLCFRLDEKKFFTFAISIADKFKS